MTTLMRGNEKQGEGINTNGGETEMGVPQIFYFCTQFKDYGIGHRGP